MRILAFADYYLPGFQAGGPIRALSNLVDTFDGELSFDIVTRDYDLGGKPYPGVVHDVWHPVGPAKVRYVGRRGLSLVELRRLLASDSYDAVYLNSFFSPLSRAVILVRTFLERRRLPLIVAPRGEFSAEALMLKPLRKRVYLWLIRKTSALSDVVWQASSVHESQDIRRALDGSISDRSVIVTKELLARPMTPRPSARGPKRPGHATLVFLSRISPMKNLEAAIEVLRGVQGSVRFVVYGPIDDASYWGECERAARALPANVKMEYLGPVAHENVASILSQNDLFFLPTRGENYGHVIVEALLAGCPVLISDRTHWRDLKSKGLGWDLSLEDIPAFREVIERVVKMDEATHSLMRRRAVEFADQIVRDDTVVEQNRTMFLGAARARPTAYDAIRAEVK
jgi:glycosyltransferase involved in cell wall biosynthesis